MALAAVLGIDGDEGRSREAFALLELSRQEVMVA